jgi:hypothetical protein
MVRKQLGRLLSSVRVQTKNIMRQIGKQPPRRLFIVALLLTFATIAAYVVVVALNHALFFDGYAANGAFQLLNPLRRLADGGVIGTDFNFFHGVGVPLVHMPFYYLFGQGLFGSEMARWLVSPVLFVAAAYSFFYFFKRSRLFAASMTAWVTALSIYILPSIALPRNSMLGVRSTVAVFLMAVILNQERLRRLWSHKRFFQLLPAYELIVGLLLAIGFICGTEFGVAAILAYATVTTLYSTETGSTFLTRAGSAVRVLSLSAGWLILLLTAITRGNPLEPLRYALAEIPIDQFWYFGVPPNKFLHTDNLFTILLKDENFLASIAVAILAVVLVIAVHRLRKHRIQVQTFLFGLMAGALGMVSMLGYYHYTETGALLRMSLLVGGAASVLLIARWQRPVMAALQLGKYKKRLRITPHKGLHGLGMLFIGGSLVFTGITIAQMRSEYDVVGIASRTFGYLSGKNTNLLGPEWRTVDEEVMRVVNADNALPVADISNRDYEHGIRKGEAQFVLDAGKRLSFVKPRQIIYFPKAGRQIIKSVERQRDNRVLVTLQDEHATLSPKYDGAPAKVVFAENFNRDDTHLWSMYTGLIEEEAKTFHPTKEGYDYIIHALGPDRREEYVREFSRTKPEFVLTLRKDYFIYADWAETLHWDFYSLLDQNYEVAKETSIYVVWQRREQPWANKHIQTDTWHALSVDSRTQQVALPNLDFSKAPDINLYAQQAQQTELKHQEEDLGRELPPARMVRPELYDRMIIDREHARRDFKLWRQENSGVDSEALEKAQWRSAMALGRSENEIMGRVVRPLPGNVTLPRPKRQVILVRMQYDVSHPLSVLPIVGKTTRYFVEPNRTYSTTAISLRPYAKEAIFPIVLSEYNDDPYLQLKSYGLLPGDADFKVKKIEWTLLDTSVPNLKALTE